MTRRNTKFLPGALVALALAVPSAAVQAAGDTTGNRTDRATPSAAGGADARSDSGTAARTPGTAQPGEAKLSRGDRKFIEKAAKDGLAEVQISELAARKASSQQVREFAQQMVQEHGKTNEQLKSVAQAQGITLPTELDRGHRRDLEKLQKLSGAEFDREYMERMVDDHEKDVKAFRNQAEDGENADLKQFASSVLPNLEHHLSMAKQTEEVAKAQAEGEEGRGVAGRRGTEAESGAAGSRSGTGKPGGY